MPVPALSLLAALALVLAACGTSADDPSSTTAGPTSTTRPSTTTTGLVRDAVVEMPDQLAFVTEEWDTDFGTRSIDLEELLVGIPAADPRDLIRPIDEPIFETVTEADSWIDDVEPGVMVEIDGAARFYPLGTLTRHEIVNDRFEDQPVVITYCPLCNTAIAFDPTVDGRALRFGVSGLLRNSDLVMWDDETQSLWQQITGEAIVGSLTGAKLRPVGSAIVRWADFRDAKPGGEVLSRDLGFGVPYGLNPYVAYSTRSRPYGFFEGEIDDRYPALERVVGVGLDTGDKAYPFGLLGEERVVNDVVGGTPVVIMWGAPDTADALEAEDISQARGIGTGVAYLATVDGQTLTFTWQDGDRFVDEQTGTTWTLLGEAVEGPLAGAELDLAPHRNEFWFAWQAFFPDAEVYEGGVSTR